MAKFDIYQNPSDNGFFLELQSELLSGLNTTVVAPLLLEGQAPKPAAGLNPCFTVEGQKVVLVTQFLSAMLHSELGAAIGKLENVDSQVSAALDLLFVGF
jgi:toxin CcdB